MSVAINNLTTVDIDQSFVEKVVQVVLSGEGSQGRKVSVAFIGSGRMRKLNKKFRSKNRVTDVLSFPEREVPFEKFSIGGARKTTGLGEVVVCLREVKKSARRLGTSKSRELARVVVHGILHLLGYDHEGAEKEGERMREKEEEYLENIKIKL